MENLINIVSHAQSDHLPPTVATSRLAGIPNGSALEANLSADLLALDAAALFRLTRQSVSKHRAACSCMGVDTSSELGGAAFGMQLR